MLAHVHRPYKPDTTCNHEQSYYMYYAMHFYNFERVVEWNIVLFRMTVVYGVSKMNNIYGTFVLLLQQRYLYYNTRVSYKGNFWPIILYAMRILYESGYSRVVLRATTIIICLQQLITILLSNDYPPTRDISALVLQTFHRHSRYIYICFNNIYTLYTVGYILLRATNTAD